MDPNERPPDQPSPRTPDPETGEGEQKSKQRLVAALILTEAAEHLDTEPTGILTETAWYETFNRAAGKITDGIPIADADLAIDIAWNAIEPTPLGATRAAWQARVRQTAEDI
ncbi:hypothetical protein ACH40F_07990 [Streptomyces sp. NPDC020794]|uniref:hypothetical protein n=1 Tax=unclassified Streptomyces TaxID=2593676 RepID=UPI0036E78D47